jgi:hypothetical protein
MNDISKVIFQADITRFRARLTHEEAARTLSMSEEELAILVNTKGTRIRPLGNPAQNAPKYFAACTVYELAQDVEWLNIATELIRKTRLRKRQRLSRSTPRKAPESNSSTFAADPSSPK